MRRFRWYATLFPLGILACTSPTQPGQGAELTSAFDSPATPQTLLTRCSSQHLLRPPYEVVPPPPAKSPASAARDSIEAALYLYASTLEAYFADHNTYPTAPTELHWYHGHPDPRVEVIVHTFGPEGYALIGRHSRWPGASCVVLTAHSAHGLDIRTDLEGLPAPVDGWEPVCDSPDTNDAT